MRILVVDDEADYRYLVRVSLEVTGHEVLEASSGPEACGIATEREPDVVLVDYVLVGETGVGLIPRLRAASRSSAVVLHTVEKERGATYVGHPAGPDGLVEKGMSPSELSSALDAIVTLHRARSSEHTER